MLNTAKTIHWTEHAKMKMRQYGLSKMKLLQLIRKPERKEQGIAEGTTAVMMTNKKYGIAASAFGRTESVSGMTKSAKGYGVPRGETWLMYADDKNIRKIISCWRYPGVSKPGESIPIPEHIRKELKDELF